MYASALHVLFDPHVHVTISDVQQAANQIKESILAARELANYQALNLLEYQQPPRV